MASKHNKALATSIKFQDKPIGKLMAYLHKDTSIDKATYDKSKMDRLIEANKKHELVLKEQKIVRIVTEKRRYVQESWEKCFKDEVMMFYEKRKMYDVAAVKIQKIVKGFLVRIKVDPMLLEMREKNCDVIVKDLRKQTDFCMLTLGTNTIPVFSI